MHRRGCCTCVTLNINWILMNREQIDQLLQRFRMGLCTPEEVAAINKWYDAMAAAGEWNWTEAERQSFQAELHKGVWEGMKAESQQQEEPRTIRFRWSRIAAAAAILAALFTGGYWLVRQRTTPKEPQPAVAKTFAPDVLPGGNKAVLTLGDGSHIVLDSTKNGLISRQGNAEITKQENGRLVYQPGDSPKSQDAVAYNDLATPRGGQYQLVLPDGSKVWLNAASSIRYPTAFTGKERRVEVSGEAYFEVQRSQQNTPFIVAVIDPSGTPDGEVQVLGTHFNVNAYADDGLVRTTLLNGAVRVVKDREGILLKPGQQAGYGRTAKPELVKNADADGAIAWKNGIFQFDEDGIESVMRQVQRWYDIDVSYAGKIPSGHFSGTVERKANISQILEILEASDVHFRIDGRRIVILPE